MTIGSWPERIFREGKNIADWAGDSGPHFGVESNGGAEHLIKWKGKYYFLTSDWNSEVIYPGTFSEVGVKEELENGGFVAEYIKMEREKDVDRIAKNKFGYDNLFAFLRSQKGKMTHSILILLDLRSISRSQKTVFTLLFPLFMQQATRGRKIVFIMNEEIETSENIKTLRYIQKVCPQTVLPVGDPTRLLIFLHKNKSLYKKRLKKASR